LDRFLRSRTANVKWLGGVEFGQHLEQLWDIYIVVVVEVTRPSEICGNACLVFYYKNNCKLPKATKRAQKDVMRLILWLWCERRSQNWHL
jgi:hypothetical protein